MPIGQMVIINGSTEPGATLWVDDQKIDLFENGSFNAVIRLRTEGVNDVRIVAQDTAGNETVWPSRSISNRCCRPTCTTSGCRFASSNCRRARACRKATITAMARSR